MNAWRWVRWAGGLTLVVLVVLGGRQYLKGRAAYHRDGRGALAVCVSAVQTQVGARLRLQDEEYDLVRMGTARRFWQTSGSASFGPNGFLEFTCKAERRGRVMTVMGSPWVSQRPLPPF